MMMTLESFLLIVLAVLAISVMGLLPYLLMLAFKYIFRVNQHAIALAEENYYRLAAAGDGKVYSAPFHRSTE